MFAWRLNKTKRKTIKSPSKKTIYHGTAHRFKEINPKINKDTPLDFGRGFYTTEDRNYARDYARGGAQRFDRNKGYVRVYKFDEDRAFDTLDVKVYEEPDIEWFNFIICNRVAPYMIPPRDISIGPSADSRIQSIVDEYEKGELKRILEQESTIEQLQPYINPTQIVFHTRRSIKEPYLKYKGYAKVYVDTIEDKG